MKNTFTPLTIFGSLAVLAILGGVFFFATSQGADADEELSQEATATQQPPEENAMEQAETEAMPAEDTAQSETDAQAEQDIVETAVAAGNFTTLATALEEADLVETLKGEGPFTVFAPTDEAFAKLPEGTVDELLQNPEQLEQVLLYHVVSGEVNSTQALELGSAETINGQSVSITTNGTDVHINDASVISPDVQASNGIIHVIDTVLLPQ